MYKKKLVTYICVLAILNTFFLVSCKKNYTPKPRGYYRIDFPEKKYISTTDSFPYKFDYPAYTVLSKDNSRLSEKYWVNIEYPELNGKIHISYKEVDQNIVQLIEDTRNLAYKHTIKADAINEIMFIKPDKKVYGILYEIEGNAASSVQFFLTDSSKNYLRGALYINVPPNKDSLAPVIHFIKDDIKVLIESFEWNTPAN